jgi:hypothetical protein
MVGVTADKHHQRGRKFTIHRSHQFSGMSEGDFADFCRLLQRAKGFDLAEKYRSSVAEMDSVLHLHDYATGRGNNATSLHDASHVD